MTIVKICGVTDPAHALAAADAGADLVGLMFAPSSRRLGLEGARRIVQGLRASSGPHPRLVGVFANAEPEEVNRVATALELDMVQLSGSEADDFLGKMLRPIIKAVHVPREQPAEVALPSLGKRLAYLRGVEALPLLDTQVEGAFGGTGLTFDHRVAQALAREFEFLLGGGLTPENVAEAVSLVRPWGVDVSSGVETAGVKDPAKIRAFVDAVRHAEPI